MSLSLFMRPLLGRQSLGNGIARTALPFLRHWHVLRLVATMTLKTKRVRHNIFNVGASIQRNFTAIKYTITAQKSNGAVFYFIEDLWNNQSLILITAYNLSLIVLLFAYNICIFFNRPIVIGPLVAPCPLQFSLQM